MQVNAEIIRIVKNKHYENKCKNNSAVAIYCVATKETT